MTRLWWVTGFFIIFQAQFQVRQCKAHRTPKSFLSRQGTPWQYPFSWFAQKSVIYARLHPFRSAWYFGSTTQDIKHREQSRFSKFTQIRRDRNVYFELALRVWLLSDTYDSYIPVVVAQERCPYRLRSLEAVLIRHFRPKLNSPFVHRELKKLGVAVQPFLQLNANTGAPGKRAHRNRRHRLAPMHMDLCSTDLQ